MFAVDSLVVIGMAVLNLGSIHEEDGVIERSFWVRNDYSQPVTLIQGYTSCGCTTITYEKDKPIASGDSTQVTLRFNPRGKGGEFYENGTVVYLDNDSLPLGGIGGGRHFLNMALEGTCITSEETLMKQYPIVIADGLRLSNDHFDVGYMSAGQSRQITVSVLHKDEQNRIEPFTIDFSVDDRMAKGVQHVRRELKTQYKGKEKTFSVLFDVYVR